MFLDVFFAWVESKDRAVLFVQDGNWSDRGQESRGFAEPERGSIRVAWMETFVSNSGYRLFWEIFIRSKLFEKAANVQFSSLEWARLLCLPPPIFGDEQSIDVSAMIYHVCYPTKGLLVFNSCLYFDYL